jgi:hypothetical protein
MAALVEERNVRLSRPLGRRKLVDGATGQPTAWISARFVLRLTALPAGYRLTDLSPATEGAMPQNLGPPGASEIFRPPHAEPELDIEQSAGIIVGLGPGPGGWSPVEVRGHPGQATRNLITWQEHGLYDSIEIGGTDKPQILGTKQLIAIADAALTYDHEPLPVVPPMWG